MSTQAQLARQVSGNSEASQSPMAPEAVAGISVLDRWAAGGQKKHIVNPRL